VFYRGNKIWVLVLVRVIYFLIRTDLILSYSVKHILSIRKRSRRQTKKYSAYFSAIFVNKSELLVNVLKLVCSSYVEFDWLTNKIETALLLSN